jgi:hypothetical protein
MKIVKVFFGSVFEVKNVRVVDVPFVGRYVNLQVKVTIAEKKKRSGIFITGFVPTGWAPCCE